jgi:hypothetical protein
MDRAGPGSQPEHLRDPPGQVILGHRSVDLDGGQAEML